MFSLIFQSTCSFFQNIPKKNVTFISVDKLLFSGFCVILCMSSCSYVTFSREEEAVLCIEAVNGYILDGRPLK